MAEINNNIPSFGYNIDKIDASRKTKDTEGRKTPAEELAGQEVLKDTGVLGRSQIKNIKGADVSKSVNEAVLLAKTNPKILNSCQGMFDKFYNSFLQAGLSETDAYLRALSAEEEFYAIAKAH